MIGENKTEQEGGEVIEAKTLVLEPDEYIIHVELQYKESRNSLVALSIWTSKEEKQPFIVGDFTKSRVLVAAQKNKKIVGVAGGFYKVPFNNLHLFFYYTGR